MDVFSSRGQHKILRWVFWGCAGGTVGSVGVTVFVVILVLIVLCATVVGYSDSKGTALSTPGPGTTTVSVGSAGTTITTASQVWTGQQNRAVVDAALSIVPALYNGPPEQYDSWYRTEIRPDQPGDGITAAIAYWNQTCAGCAEWAQGNLQCVMFITAAYGVVGQGLPYVGDAATFWTTHAYAHQPGWEEIQPNQMPMPGDIGVLASPYDDGVGHVFLIVDVKPPSANGTAGYVQFAQANAAQALAQEPLTRDASGNLSLSIWANYTVLGYIRHSSAIQ